MGIEVAQYLIDRYEPPFNVQNYMCCDPKILDLLPEGNKFLDAFDYADDVRPSVDYMLLSDSVHTYEGGLMDECKRSLQNVVKNLVPILGMRKQ